MSHYQHPPPQHYQHQPPYQHHASPPVAHEDDGFRSFFRSHLATLVVNSRPIIQFLTQVAADQVSHYQRATVVSEELVRRIHEAPPHQKLPPFYLLDSISKNFPAPYAALFPQYLQLLFLATYGSVDGLTKSKMEEMLKTWRNGGAGGAFVFGIDVQIQIEQRIWGTQAADALRAGGLAPVSSRYQSWNNSDAGAATGRGRARATALYAEPTRRADIPSPLSSSPRFRFVQPPVHQQYYLPSPQPAPVQPLQPPAPSADALLIHLSAALTRSHQLQQSPFPPPNIANDVVALQSLQALVQSQQTSDDERRAIDAQLRKMDAEAAALPPPPPPPPPPAAPAAFGFLSAPGFSDMLSNVLAGAAAATPPPGTPAGEEDDYVVPEASEEGSDEVAEEEADEYEKMILGLNVSLDKLDLKAPLPRVSTIIGTLLPSQCRQCSVRAPASTKGRARLDTHMDWHYRHNKRARDSEGRGNSRAWFVDAKDWLSDPSISPDSFLPSTHASSSTNPSSSHPTSSTSTNALTPQARAALMKKHVVQPADPELAARGCPICKEPFKGEFSEDEEEWVWMNAVEEEGVIYHATCRHETKTNAGSGLLNSARAKTVASLALGKEEARSRQGSREASREKSPVVVVKMEPGMEEAAVGTGLKRKSVGEGEGDDEGAEEGKRAKLSPAPAEEAAKQE